MFEIIQNNYFNESKTNMSERAKIVVVSQSQINYNTNYNKSNICNISRSIRTSLIR